MKKVLFLLILFFVTIAKADDTITGFCTTLLAVFVSSSIVVQNPVIVSSALAIVTKNKNNKNKTFFIFPPLQKPK